MNLIFSDQAWEDYQFWLATDKKTVRRIHELSRQLPLFAALLFDCGNAFGNCGQQIVFGQEMT